MIGHDEILIRKIDGLVIQTGLSLGKEDVSIGDKVFRYKNFVSYDEKDYYRILKFEDIEELI